jgi:excisionase family DNA binding protein
MVEMELLTVCQLAERLHVRPRTVQLWARRGRIPAVRVSAKIIRFDWQAVVSTLRHRTEQTEAATCR